MTSNHNRAILQLYAGALKVGASRQIELILLFYAFAREIAPLRRRLRSRRAHDDRQLRGFRAELEGVDIAAIATGIGFDSAQAAARRALDLFPDTGLAIATGVVGALSAGLGAGDLVLADRVIVEQSDGAGNPEHASIIDADTLIEFSRCLHTAGIGFSTGALLTARRVLANGADKRAAKQTTGAIAVDMETAAIALEARARGVKFVALRAVMDSVDDEVIGAELSDKDGNVRALAAAAFLIRNPRAAVRLPRMAQNLGRATHALANALEAALRRESSADRSVSSNR